MVGTLRFAHPTGLADLGSVVPLGHGTGANSHFFPTAGRRRMPIEAYTFARFSAFAMLARHSSPAAALNLSTTSGDNRKVTACFGLSTFGRPRDRLMLACISGNTSLNGFARAKSSFVHSGLSETALMSASV